MPAFGASLSDDDLRALVSYVRSLSRGTTGRPAGG
jgi:mono/diheme cytochrome c family protein